MGVYVPAEDFTFDDIREFILKTGNQSFVVMSQPTSMGLDLMDVCGYISVADANVFNFKVLNTPKGYNLNPFFL